MVSSALDSSFHITQTHPKFFGQVRFVRIETTRPTLANSLVLLVETDRTTAAFADAGRVFCCGTLAVDLMAQPDQFGRGRLRERFQVAEGFEENEGFRALWGGSGSGNKGIERFHDETRYANNAALLGPRSGAFCRAYFRAFSEL
jgi:hypothetical protein